MASTQMTTADALRVQLWADKAWLQAMRSTMYGHLFSRGAVYIPPEIHGTDKVGDKITYGYMGKLTNVPLGEGQNAVNNAEALDLQSDSMVQNVTRIPVRSPNKDTIEQHRTHIKFHGTNLQKLLKNRVSEIVDTATMYHLGGASPTTLTIDGTTYSSSTELLHVQGHNAPTQPSSDRILRAGNQSTDQALTSSDTMTLTLVDYALERVGNSIQPLSRLAGDTYDLIISEEQQVDLHHDAGSSIQWWNLELGRIQGGRTDSYIDKPFKNNMKCAGRYKNVNIYVSPRTAYGENSSSGVVITTVRRAVLVGMDALSYASKWGGTPSDSNTPVRFYEELEDLEYYKVTEARLIWGLNKVTPSNKEDNGSFVISTYAAAHSS